MKTSLIAGIPHVLIPTPFNVLKKNRLLLLSQTRLKNQNVRQSAAKPNSIIPSCISLSVLDPYCV